MLRLICFLAGVLLSSIAVTQDWRCFRADREASFIRNINLPSELKVVKIDTVVIDGNIETNYFFNTIRKASSATPCYTPTGVSWMGNSMTCSDNGINTFRSNYYDTLGIGPASFIISINTLAGLNETWNMCNLPNGDYIEAKVVYCSIDTIFGTADSVKRILVFYKNLDGIIINGPLNYHFLDLSKSHGLISIFNFDIFPYIQGISWQIPLNESLEQYYLVGLTNPDVGENNLNFSKVYDFNPGDEYHTFDRYYVFCCPQFEINHRTVNKVIDRTFSPDSLYSNYSIYQITENRSYTNGVLTEISHTSDTITAFYYNAELYNALNAVPYELIHDNYQAVDDFYTTTQFVDVNRRSTKTFPKLDKHFIQVSASCLVPNLLVDPNLCTGENYYIEGLGGPYYKCYYNAMNYTSHELQYYKKGEETWGDPFDIGVWLNRTDDLSEEIVKVFPNPAESEINIQLSQSVSVPCNFEIYNLLGGKVYSYNLMQSINHLNISLKPGIYLYIVTGNISPITTGKLLINLQGK